jgi:hypothetical protein
VQLSDLQTPDVPEAPTVELQDVNQQEANAPEVTATEEQAELEQGKQPDRVFSQAELDAAVQKRLLRERRRWDRELHERQAPAPTPRQATEEGQEPQAARVTDADIQAYLAKQKSAEALRTFQEKAEDAVEKHPDYMRVVTDPRVPFSDEMIEFFAESDVGVDLAYQLAKDPSKVIELRRMSPLKAGRELTRLEAEVKAKPVAKPSKAPDPISPVGSRSTSTASALPSDSDDIATWMRKERERVKRG